MNRKFSRCVCPEISFLYLKQCPLVWFSWETIFFISLHFLYAIEDFKDFNRFFSIPARELLDDSHFELIFLIDGISLVARCWTLSNMSISPLKNVYQTETANSSWCTYTGMLYEVQEPYLRPFKRFVKVWYFWMIFI